MRSGVASRPSPSPPRPDDGKFGDAVARLRGADRVRAASVPAMTPRAASAGRPPCQSGTWKAEIAAIILELLRGEYESGPVNDRDRFNLEVESIRRRAAIETVTPHRPPRPAARGARGVRLAPASSGSASLASNQSSSGTWTSDGALSRASERSQRCAGQPPPGKRESRPRPHRDASPPVKPRVTKCPIDSNVDVEQLRGRPHVDYDADIRPQRHLERVPEPLRVVRPARQQVPGSRAS